MYFAKILLLYLVFLIMAGDTVLAFSPLFKTLNYNYIYSQPKVSVDRLSYFFKIKKSFKQEKYKEVILAYQGSPFFEKNMENKELLYGLTVAYFYSGNTQKALNFLNQILEKDDEDPEVLEIAGLIYWQLGIRDIAQKFLKKAFEKSEKPEYLLVYIGFLLKTKKIEDALNYLDLFNKKFPSSSYPWYYYYKGLVLFYNENYEEAALNFRAFLMLAKPKDISRIPERERSEMQGFIKQYVK